ncbi:MAG: NAD(P)/FAD-dependent oxidoreductase [Sphingomonadaceae bacterium]|nr:NAD(P)/FAD-dependent oxidoreductase [Sphingomonadaceae bacterium]
MIEHHRLIVIGGGPGGIAMSHALLKEGIDDFIVLEKASEPGGTWHHNRYPGAECDIMSHLYSFSFAPNPYWSQRYARQPEILAYMHKVVEQCGIAPHLRLSEGVTSLEWDASGHRWTVRSEKAEYTADMVVSAVGMFNTPILPAIDGIEGFKGQLIHTAHWPDGDMLEGKNVAVIGSAASAVQLIPEIAKTVKHLKLFQRTPIWVTPKDDGPYTEAEIQTFVEDPEAMSTLRAEIEARVNGGILFDDPDLRERALEAAKGNITAVKDPEVRRKLTPWLPYGSRRPLLSNYYYPSFNRENVELVTEPIDRIEESGLRTADDQFHEVDVIISATGFTVSRFASIIDIKGRDGRELAEEWSGDPSAFLGVMVPDFPNLVIMYGPNTNNGSLLTMLESQADFAVRQLKRMEHEGVASIEIRRDVTEAYNVQLQQTLDNVEVWQAQPDGYYRGASGQIVTQWPDTMTEYERRLCTVDPGSFETVMKETASP